MCNKITYFLYSQLLSPKKTKNKAIYVILFHKYGINFIFYEFYVINLHFVYFSIILVDRSLTMKC